MARVAQADSGRRRRREGGGRGDKRAGSQAGGRARGRCRPRGEEGRREREERRKGRRERRGERGSFFGEEVGSIVKVAMDWQPRELPALQRRLSEGALEEAGLFKATQPSLGGAVADDGEVVANEASSATTLRAVRARPAHAA